MLRIKVFPVLVAALVVAAAVPAPAQTPGGVAPKQVGIETAKVDSAFSFQERSQWCWAACISMLLAHNDLHVEQAEIVRRSYGRDALGQLPDWPGSFDLITRNLNYRGRDGKGTDYEIRARVAPGAPMPALLLAELSSGSPVLVGYNTGSGGHAVLITAASYVDTPMGPQILQLVSRDPYPYPGTSPIGNGRQVVPGAHLASRIMAHWYVDVKTAGTSRRRQRDTFRAAPEAALQVQHDDGSVAVAFVSGAADEVIAEVRLHDAEGRLVGRQQGIRESSGDGFAIDFAGKWSEGDISLRRLTLDGDGRASLQFSDDHEATGWAAVAGEDVQEWSTQVAQGISPASDLDRVDQLGSAELLAEYRDLGFQLEALRRQYREAEQQMARIQAELNGLLQHKTGWLRTLQQLDANAAQAQQGVARANSTLAQIEYQLRFLHPASPQAQQLRFNGQQVLAQRQRLQVGLHKLAVDRQRVVANLMQIDQLGEQKLAQARAVEACQAQVRDAGQQAKRVMAQLQSEARRAVGGLRHR